jgi:hypothetical protein
MQNEIANTAMSPLCPHCCPNYCPGCGRPYWAQPSWYPVYPWYTQPYTITWSCNSTSNHEVK